MWIVQNNSFLSIVADRTNSENLLVRGRIKGDIEAVFPDAKVIKTKDADYLYRAFLPREVVVKVIAEKVEAIDYPNFKNSVKTNLRHDIYMEIWQVMYNAQQFIRNRFA